VEAWSHLKPKYHKKMMDFYGVICDDIDRLIKNATAQRKPRKKKTLSATRLVSKLKYQKEFSDLKLVSINSEKLIGANELWIYNTKYKTLGVYYSVNSIRGLSVKGCTIQNFDKDTSIQKTARKPKEVLKVLNKSSLKKQLKDIKTKGFSLDNPAYLSAGQLVSGFTNVPLDRVIIKLQNIQEAMNEELQWYERMALLGGWKDWELGIKEGETAKYFGDEFDLEKRQKEIIKQTNSDWLFKTGNP